MSFLALSVPWGVPATAISAVLRRPQTRAVCKDKQQIQEAARGQQVIRAEKIHLEMTERGEHRGGET